MNTRLPTTTQDRKWGRYITVCNVRLYFVDRTSLSINATMMGAGKPMAIFNNEMITVFCSTVVNMGLPKSFSKFLKPVHAQSHMSLVIR